MTKLRAMSINVGVLILLVPIGASIYTAVVADHRMFIPAGILVGLAVWAHRAGK